MNNNLQKRVDCKDKKSFIDFILGLIVAFIFPSFAAIGVSHLIASEYALDVMSNSILLLRLLLVMIFIVIGTFFVIKKSNI